MPLDALAAEPPLVQAAIAGAFTWLLTAAGATLVFFRRELPPAFLDAMLGFAAGVMTAASFFSLLAPAVELAEEGPLPAWVPAVVGFALGGLALAVVDKALPHLHPGAPMREREGPPTAWQRATLLVLAITLHNIPEGLAVGVAFGALAHDLPGATFAGASALALGIAIQNVPEGLAVAMPLRREGVPRWKCFFAGQASALVEPVAAVAGAGAVLLARPILPYALAFAAGAMIFVVVEELIPEAQRGGRTDLVTLATLGGFALMMALDVGLG